MHHPLTPGTCSPAAKCAERRASPLDFQRKRRSSRRAAAATLVFCCHAGLRFTRPTSPTWPPPQQQQRSNSRSPTLAGARERERAAAGGEKVLGAPRPWVCARRLHPVACTICPAPRCPPAARQAQCHMTARHATGPADHDAVEGHGGSLPQRERGLRLQRRDVADVDVAGVFAA